MESSKRMKANFPKIGTHSGVFHCDEVLACFMLKQLPEYKESEIVRSRNEDDLDKCEIVVDVGGIFDPECKRFDHHQRSFSETLSSLFPKYGPNNLIKLSSAGLVYAFYGKEVIQNVLKDHKEGFELSEEDLDKVYYKLYKNFIEEMDAIDNGVPQFDGEPKYSIKTHLGARVGSLNPNWTEDFNSEQVFERFQQAMELVGREFIQKVLNTSLVWWPARAMVKEAIENRFNVDESGLILDLEMFCPWTEHYFELEAEMNLKDLPKYIIFADSTNGYRVRAIPVSETSFVLRHPLPEKFRGVRDQDLATLSGIESMVFVHATGFIGGCKTKEDALKLARLSLTMS